MNAAREPIRNTLHLLHFDPEVGSLPNPQRINAFNKPGAGRIEGQGRSSFII